MQAQTLLSQEEYLHSSFEYEPEYVDGELVERSMPTDFHARLIARLIGYLEMHRKNWRIEVLPDVRLQVTPNRVRLPDIAVMNAPYRPQGVVREIPIFVIEILSPDDRLSTLRAKAREYLEMGIRHVWSIDPESGECYQHTLQSMRPIDDRILQATGTPITIPLPEILASLDD